tara:strand:+ start:51 stop:656 length:606 start_codon:yes stop_codon:yes gene_type:complete
MIKGLFLLIILFSYQVFASEWSPFEEINFSRTFIKIDENSSDIIGSLNPSAWITTAKLEGATASESFIQNFSDKGFLYINHVRMPPAWSIRYSGNDKRYIKDKTAWMLNIDNRKNPIKKLSKKDITRYRDYENNVVPYVYFEFEGSDCVVFKKGFSTQESGYEKSKDDDETLITIFCSYVASLSDQDVESIIDSVNIKNRM